VIGGGIAGLAVGWRLAQQGAGVVVCERGRIGQGASHAAAGMLAAGVEIEPGEETLWPLTRAAQRAWPAFAAELEAASGADLGYRAEGTLVAARSADDLRRLERLAAIQAALGVRLERLTGAGLRAREPALAPGLVGGFYSPDDHQVENRALAPALASALRANGGEIREDCPVAGLELAGERLRGLRLADGGLLGADAVVLAAGAWSAGLPGLPAACRPPVRPVKGQMLALRMDPVRPLLRHVLWGPGIYLVPRRDGRLLLGATVEEKGFEESITAGGLLTLLEAAWRLLPGLEELPVAETWVGFRPTSRDDAPILGATPLPGLFLATGQHRNGILLLPTLAEAVAAAVLGQPLPAAARPFTLARFQRPGERAA
jgi:glycine oxidase